MRAATQFIVRVGVVVAVAAAVQVGANATAGAATMVESDPTSTVVKPLPLRAT